VPWESSDRRQELPADWATLRNQALERDHFRCVWPGRWKPENLRCNRPATDVDHVKRGNDHRLSNLQSLCPQHHAAKTAKESAEVRAEQQAKLSFPEQYPKHPGLR
jgi:5-methylcytosine-specific restriction enzyme A